MTWPSVRFLSFAKHFAESSRNWQNVVDVPDGQGFLQLGLVVDTSKEGIHVDFFCKGQRPRLVAFGRLFYCSAYGTREIGDSDDYDENADHVQVLVRTSSDVPFTWFAAKLLNTDIRLYELYPPRLVEVELEWAGAVVKEIVHSSQIRNVPDHEKTIAVWKNHFVIRSWAVPERYASSLSEDSLLWKIYDPDWYATSGMLPLRIRNGNVEYLAVAHGAPRRLLNVENRLDELSGRIKDSLEKGLVWSGRYFTQAPVTMLPDDSPACISVPVPWLTFLPAHLLGEIFKYLDSVGRVRQRRVCTLWNCVLSMEALFLDVWLCPKEIYGCPFRWPFWETVHAVVLSMTTLVTKSTKWVIIEGSGDKCNDIGEPLRLIADVARYFKFPRAERLGFLISQYSWFLDYNVRLKYGVKELAALCKEIEAACDCLVWKDCTFMADNVFSVLQVRRGRIKPASSTLQADTWEILDSNALEPNLGEVYQWLDEGYHEDLRLILRSVLEQFQIPDPRLVAQSRLYRGDELVVLMGQDNWEMELDIRRLSRLTLWALLDKIRWKPLH